MDFDEKIHQLRGIIEAKLLPLITGNYVLYDLPYHANIGDTLIWEGELALLKQLPFRCLDYASRLTCRFPDLPEETIILFHGGGNMGDLYPEHMDFLIKLAATYKKNKIVVFPQTFYYADRDVLEANMKALSVNNRLIVCARDEYSYRLLQDYIGRRALLVPDMAFCIDTEQFEKHRCRQREYRLYIKRTDSELKEENSEPDSVNMVTKDWPTFSSSIFDGLWAAKIWNKLSSGRLPWIGHWIDRRWDRYASTTYKNKLLCIGIRFISPFKEIYTTRLHGCLLAVLLHKEVTLMDNSYGKNANFYRTWLTDVEKVHFLNS